MTRSWYNHKPDPIEDRKSVEDFLAWRFPDQTRLNDLRTQLVLVNGKILALERSGSQQGLAGLRFERPQLLGEIVRLETRLGLRFKPNRATGSQSCE